MVLDIDVVYTWVNHLDQGWRDIYYKHVPEVSAGNIHASALSSSRFISRDELYYSIVSVLKHAPWVRNVYVVTNCSVPERYKNLPKTVYIHHDEIFQDPADLPTFNSRAIEANLFRIEGLSENFIYLNDDMFLLRPFSKEEFFPERGRVAVSISHHDIPYALPAKRLRPVDNGAINAGLLLRERFDKLPKKKLHHGPYVLKKSICHELWGLYSKKLKITSSNKIRNPNDLPLSTTLHAYYALYSGRGVISGFRCRYVDIGNPLFPFLTNRLSPLRRGGYDVLCLNEVHSRWYMRLWQGAYIRHLLESII